MTKSETADHTVCRATKRPDVPASVSLRAMPSQPITISAHARVTTGQSWRSPRIKRLSVTLIVEVPRK